MRAGSARREQRLGTTVADRYVLNSVIGEGGAATIFAATDLRLGGECAVKILHVVHPTAARRLEREARVASSLQHPNVCRVTDLGRIDAATPYLVMERLVGRTLEERLVREGYLPIDESLEIAKQVLSVLHVAHERGFVHRDIKPANLFLVDVVGRPPLVKVLDFGVASADSEQGLTDRGSIVGTPSYMSPEQAAAYPDIDGRTDIYACAVVLYQCLSGRQPFRAAKSLDLLDLIIRGGAVPVSAHRPDVPAHVAKAIDRAMRVEREARFATALEMIEVLEGKVDMPHESWDMSTAQLEPLGAEQAFDDVTDPFIPPPRPRKR